MGEASCDEPRGILEGGARKGEPSNADWFGLVDGLATFGGEDS